MAQDSSRNKLLHGSLFGSGIHNWSHSRVDWGYLKNGNSLNYENDSDNALYLCAWQTDLFRGL